MDFSAFWDLVTDVWQHGYAGLDISRLVIAFGILFVALLVRGLFCRFVLHYVRKATAHTETEADDIALAALEPPLRMVPIVMGIFFATNYLSLQGDYQDMVNTLNRTLVVLNMFWALHRAVTPLALFLERTKSFLSDAMVDWFIKLFKVAVILFGAATILEMWGIEVAPLLAGLGLFGVAVALGAQDLFKNLISGLFVIGEHRFEKGDWIKVAGVVEGTVEEIGFRTTTIRQFDKAPVYVPNGELSDNAVVNFSRMTHRRIKWMIGIEYRASVDQLRSVRDGIEAYIMDNEAFATTSDISTFVRIDRFSDSSIDIFLYCFTKTTNWGEWLEIKEDLACAIKEIVEGAGTAFAYPSRSLYIEHMPGGDNEPAEIFHPQLGTTVPANTESD